MITVPAGRSGIRPTRGFTLIELMIVVAIIAIILTLALPVYTDYTTRAKVGEALSVGAAAKTAVSATCVEDPTIASLNNDQAGYSFTATTYVATIEASGPCSDPVITITTQNIGVSPDIVLTLTGDLTSGSSRVDWVCATTSANNYVPVECRS